MDEHAWGKGIGREHGAWSMEHGAWSMEQIAMNFVQDIVKSHSFSEKYLQICGMNGPDNHVKLR